MIRAFLEHHLDRAARGEITNAIRNCHARGLHSVMLHDEPGNRIRLFYADASHELWVNSPRSGQPMTLAVHSHHCEVTLIGLFGTVFNHTYSFEDRCHADQACVRHDWIECEFESAITGNGAKLMDTGYRLELNYEHHSIDRSVLSPNGTRMDAKTLHTISVPRSTKAAWLVIEGKEDPEYSSTCYTNNPTFNTEGLYLRQPGMAVTALAEALEGMR